MFALLKRVDSLELDECARQLYMNDFKHNSNVPLSLIRGLEVGKYVGTSTDRQRPMSIDVQVEIMVGVSA